MSVESGPMYSVNPPPSYSMHANSQMGNNFTPPPNYPQQRRLSQQQQQQGGPQGTQNTVGGNSRNLLGQNQVAALQRMQYQNKMVEIEKERLLQQQKAQQIVVPVNATTSGKIKFNEREVLSSSE